MISRQLSYELALVAMVCTTAVFLFPSVSGPYSAVHGPVTDLLSLTAEPLMLAAFLLAALRVSGLGRVGSSCGIQILDDPGCWFRSSGSRPVNLLRC
jgi:hypothetical protein